MVPSLWLLFMCGLTVPSTGQTGVLLLDERAVKTLHLDTD